MKGKRFVLTADRSLMSNYRDNMLYGFIACMPAEKVNKYIYEQVFCPSVEYDPDTGKAMVAPLSVRRVESGLLYEHKEDDVMVTHPYHIEKAIGEDTEIVGLSVMDPLGIGPVPSATTQGTLTPINRITFKELCLRVKRLKDKYKFKVVVGGSGAWQLSFKKSIREEYGIDHLVLGEVDDKIVSIYNDIMDGKASEIIYTFTNEIKDIPYIRAPTTNGCIEAMRGCGRGCDFCAPNLRVKRDFPIDRLKQEAMINLRYGITSIWLLSDELLLYGCDNKDLRPNKDAVVELFRELKALPNVNYIGMVHLTFSSAMAEPDCIREISRINNFGPDRWNGVQTGLETASPELIRKHMPYKVKPFTPEEWPWIVKEAIKLLNENYYFVANTIVVGLPGETDDDVKDTIDLIKSLDGMATVVAPLLYTDYNNPNNTVTSSKMTELQWKLYYLCWYLNAKTVANWIWYGTAHFNPIVRLVATVFTKLGVWYVLRRIRDHVKVETKGRLYLENPA